MRRVGIVGASGYTGAELLRLVAQHPDLEVGFATGDTSAGRWVGDLFPSLAAAYPELTFASYAPELLERADLVFLALPHGESQKLMPELRRRALKIVDLAADFRLFDAGTYAKWYGHEHLVPELLDTFAYGLPELFADDIAKADAVASAGCYPTAAALALAPLVGAGILETTGVIVDAASGVSGAGRGLRHSTHFGTVNEDFTAYGLLDHRHTPEIEQATGASVLFTPHLAPMTRGILATCYARPLGAPSTAELLDLLRATYADAPFVMVTEHPPSTKATWGSNSAHLTARRDPRTGWVVLLSAIDNLVKGASGQALQCANLLLGLEETAGLSPIGVYP